MDPKRVSASIKCWKVTPPPAPTHVPGPIAALNVSGSQASFAFTITSRGTDAARPETVEFAAAETLKLDGPVGEAMSGDDCPLVHPNRASTEKPTIKRIHIVLAPSPRGGDEEQTRCRMNTVLIGV